MKILVISDFFYKQILISRDVIDYRKWNDSILPLLSGYDSIVIDMTFENKESNPTKIKLLYELKTMIAKPDYLSKKNLILVVVCGSPKEDFKFDEPYDPAAADKVYDYRDFSSYDFLNPIVPEFLERVEYGEGKYAYSTSLSLISINLYLDRYKSVPTFLCYDYDPDSEKCVDITPLAKTKETGRDCVAFECKCGRGLSVILPSYSVKDKEKAFLLLLGICRNYFKKKEGIRELTEVKESIPPLVREPFIEALSCFYYNFFTASLLLCRRALEESAIHQGSGKKKFLRNKIELLFKKKIIDSSMREVAIEIIEFGNWGAHAGKYQGKEITEEDVISAIEFLKIYFDYAYCIPDKLKLSAERRQELKSKKNGG